MQVKGDRWAHAVEGVVFDPVTGEGVGYDIETGVQRFVPARKEVDNV